ncbi:MAG TPA: LamG-like jellyroll fold domain-containing protein [Verrucomicrobiae bacterium]|nr:LamG-like jellyroll fold domain-containing protein [Verrucomicrobiae bacterium]
MALRWNVFIVTLLVPFASLVSAASPEPLRGFLNAHDPSTIVKCKDRYYMFCTGQGIVSKSSADKIFWTPGPKVFANPPAWTTSAVPGFGGIFWAPDVLYFNNQYHLYYSVSTWGSQVSAIGLVTNPTLDPTDPNYLWTDHGPVISSTNGMPYNTIDPNVVRDGSGNIWLCFGSYWNGIYLTQLNPLTGMRVSGISPVHRLAYNSSIEASSILYHDGYYYLFCNWGSCCDGVDSTYNVRMGRSTSITGPYLDRNGVNMVNGGGTLFLRATGKYTGPGHLGFLSEAGTTFLSHHYYDANAWDPGYNAYGMARFALWPLSWTADGWPACDNDWSAIYSFKSDAHDENGQYSGLLLNGAQIERDSTYGHVLDLDGADQYIWLPPGVGYAQTFVAVVNWRGGASWQRIFDFGTDTSRYVMLTPSSSDNVLRLDIRAGGPTQILQWNQPLPKNAWTQVAVTLDGTKGILYVNGAAVVTNNISLLPLNVAPQTNHLGRSKFVADANFNGQFASFRVYGHALTAAEMVAPVPTIALPQTESRCGPGGTINFKGSATDFVARPLDARHLTWLIQHIYGGTTNVVFGPVTNLNEGSYTLPANDPSATNGVYRVLLMAVDNSGRKATNSVDVLPVPIAPAPDWTAFYPFTHDGSDASNHFNGTLVNGASIVNEPSRGNVLNLSAPSKQYVHLPAAAGVARTVSGWVKWNGGGNAQRIFDFGRNTQCYFYLTASDGSGRLRCAISPNTADWETVQSPAALSVGQWTHVAVTLNGREGILYVNGNAVAVNNSLNLLPSDIAPIGCSFGKSQFPNDPFFNGQLSAMRLDSKTLTRAELIAPQAAILQPTVTNRFKGGSLIQFSGAAKDYTGAILSANAFSWRGELHSNEVVYPAFGPWVGITAGAYLVPTNAAATTNVFYRINLTVTDANDNQQTASTDVAPQSSVLTFDTVPAGLALTLDGQTLIGSTSITAVAGMSRALNVPSPQLQSGTNFSFVMWSDGGAQTHRVMVPDVDSHFTASFVQPDIEFSSSSEGLDLSWPQWAAPMKLEFTTNLNPPVIWSELITTPERSNGKLSVHLSPTNQNQFYRLKLPSN